VRTQIALAKASAIMISPDSNGGDRRSKKAKCLGAYLFFLPLIALRFELRELLRSENALGIFHELGLGRSRAPRFVVFGHRRFHLRLLIWCEIESRERGRAGQLPFVPRLLRAIAVFTREHCSRCECARRH